MGNLSFVNRATSRSSLTDKNQGPGEEREMKGRNRRAAELEEKGRRTLRPLYLGLAVCKTECVTVTQQHFHPVAHAASQPVRWQGTPRGLEGDRPGSHCGCQGPSEPSRRPGS